MVGGYQTLREDWYQEIFEICYWQDDGIDHYKEPDRNWGANHITLRQAQQNFIKFGAMEDRFLKNVRSVLIKMSEIRIGNHFSIWSDYMLLFRPIGKAELELIEKNDYTAFPPRLPQQPIFYPVLNQQYAEEIAQKWNTKDINSQFQGYVVKFEVDDTYISQFEVQTVGKSYHQELWIPAEEVENFNRFIIGKIEIVKSYE